MLVEVQLPLYACDAAESVKVKDTINLLNFKSVEILLKAIYQRLLGNKETERKTEVYKVKNTTCVKT